MPADMSFVLSFNECFREGEPSPKAALTLVESHELTPAAAGVWLYAARESLSVKVLGACLGHHHDYWKQLAVEFPTNFDFRGQWIVDAIRTYLWTFQLPGESAQIERIIGGFAAAFFAHNPPLPSPARTGLGSSDPTARGWYIKQPGKMCIACGAARAGGFADENDSFVDRQESLNSCQACKLVAFCYPCSKRAGQLGHAIGGRIGYGRACVAAVQAAGLDVSEIIFTLPGGYKHAAASENEYLCKDSWPRTSPFAAEDSVMVLSYAIIMLTTDLHNAKVRHKMTKQQFLASCRGTNDGRSFPGDFLSDVYDDIAAQELKMRTSAEAAP